MSLGEESEIRNKQVIANTFRTMCNVVRTRAFLTYGG